MLIVRERPDLVEAELAAGKLACPHCGGELRPWGHARERTARLGQASERHRPRRARCSACTVTSVLLEDRFLARRVDAGQLIGQALVAKASGHGQRKVAAVLGRPRETVRNWLRRFEARAADITRHFSSWALALDARLHELAAHGSPLADAVEAIAVAARSASLVFGPRSVWSWASAMTGGGLLANTSWPFPAPS